MACPDLITTGEYGDIRSALGFAMDDTDGIPDNLIEGRAYLCGVEVGVRQLVPAAETIVDTGDPDYDADRASALQLGVILMTAARLARYYFAAKQGEEVASEGAGPVKVTYRTGPEWLDLAERLAEDAAAKLQLALGWGASATSLRLTGQGGPTRAAACTGRQITVLDITEALWPPVVKGHDFALHPTRAARLVAW